MSSQSRVDIGDKVVHPKHGVGVVTATSQVDLGGGPVAYVTIALDDGLTLKVPAASLSDVGIRVPVTALDAEDVLAVLRKPADEDPGHSLRRRRDGEKLGSGSLIECAEVVRDLTAVCAAHPKGGADADRSMLSAARAQLASELAVSLRSTPEQALARIDSALSRGVMADD